MAQVQSSAQVIDEAIERAKKTGIEICTSCGRDMGFPTALHVDHPKRFEGGAHFNEGGQSCPTCARAQERFSIGYHGNHT
jgi:hypothetical protein